MGFLDWIRSSSSQQQQESDPPALSPGEEAGHVSVNSSKGSSNSPKVMGIASAAILASNSKSNPHHPQISAKARHIPGVGERSPRGGPTMGAKNDSTRSFSQSFSSVSGHSIPPPDSHMSGLIEPIQGLNASSFSEENNSGTAPTLPPARVCVIIGGKDRSFFFDIDICF
jgi:hypothetical protein